MMTNEKNKTEEPLFVVWKDDYSLNVGNIDSQHKTLLKLVNNLFLTVREKNASDAVQTTLNELMDHTYAHFRDEENFMKAIGYPGYGEHRILHEKLGRQLLTLSSQHHQLLGDISVDLLHFLRDHWLRHILFEDMKIVSFLKEEEKARS